MKKVALIILDGVGLACDSEYNAVTRADTPYLDGLYEKHSFARLKDYGSCVGLPEFQTGGSEVGHITIGAGRQVKHLLTKINEEIESGRFFSNQVLLDLFEKAKKKNRIHFTGMLSDGGIHSFQPHVYGLLQMAKKYEIENVFLHLFSDGRDVGERSLLTYLSELEPTLYGARIASLSGRFFSMDRDENWERVQSAYDVMCTKDGKVSSDSPAQSIQKFYDSSDQSDYYFPPVCFLEEGKIDNDDVLINFNFRVDRSRALSLALTQKNFSSFSRDTYIDSENYGVFGPYSLGAQEPFNFGEESVKNTIGEVVAKSGKTQLRISETEKFNHVTYYMSGQSKELFNGEERILIPSPKCRSYAQKPEMSAREQKDACIKACQEKNFDLVIQNYANGDLVGHSGDFLATKKAMEVIDECLSEQVPALLNLGYDVFITADHGNADSMKNIDNTPNASHTKAPVPFLWVNLRGESFSSFSGTLQDIAPTILDVLGVTPPPEMTGKILTK